jgi:hypothetical protein
MPWSEPPTKNAGLIQSEPIPMDRCPTHQTDADFGDRYAAPIKQRQEMVKRKTRRKQTEH